MHSFKAVPVLVTGAGRGVGKRLAIGFSARGARVGLLARSKAELDLCHLEIEHAGGSALRIRADVCDYEQVCAGVERIRVHFGSPVQVLVCAAAIQGPIGPFVDTAPKSWSEIVRTNLCGVINACRAVLPHMIERRSGKIIVLTGGGVTDARPNFAVYSATKTAVARFVESVAEEVSEHNVQINCMSPGGTYTHMTDQILAAGDRAGWREIEQARQVRLTGGIAPEKQIELALFLASEQSNHISGRLIHVQDDWKRWKDRTVNPELYTLRRVQKV
ncbi:MAG: short-chain dehydrogenase [Acidobacteria bacterium]|nr:MAG: short-chain dehydrogenase [Acidobacteriota bacterium]